MLRKFLCVTVFAFAGILHCAAQESLLLGPGDQIHVKVFDTPELEQHPRITDAGNARLLFLGDVKVGGLTPGDAAREIEAKLREMNVMRNPQVEVTVEEFGTQQVSVMGQVKDPGAYEITSGMPILSILSMAGGLTELADRHITVQRRGNPNERVTYFFANSADEALNQGVRVYPGDTIVVPKVPLVYIIGDVARPGGYPINTNDSKISVLQAVAMAGYINKTANENKARLIRKTKSGSEEIHLELALIEKGSSPDVELLADDIVFVPFSWMKNVAISSSSIVSSTAGAAVYVAR